MKIDRQFFARGRDFTAEWRVSQLQAACRAQTCWLQPFVLLLLSNKPLQVSNFEALPASKHYVACFRDMLYPLCEALKAISSEPP